jgi:hypothetical protein
MEWLFRRLEVVSRAADGSGNAGFEKKPGFIRRDIEESAS